MFYGYVRRLYPKGRALGICFVVNGAQFFEYKKLFNIFEQCIEWLTDYTSIIGFDEQGRLVPLIRAWYEGIQDVSEFMGAHRNSLSRLHAEKLRPLPYGESARGRIMLPMDVSKEEFLHASASQKLVIMSKDKGADAPGLLRQRTMLREQHQRIMQLQAESNELKRNVDRLRKEKKQFKWVISLLLLLMLGGGAFYYSYTSMNAEISFKNDVITDNKHKIKRQEEEITVQDSRIKNYEQQVANLIRKNKTWPNKYRKSNAERDYHEKKYNELEKSRERRKREQESMEEAANYWQKQYQMK